MTQHLYRVHILEQPEWEEREVWKDYHHDGTHTRKHYTSHVPAGWWPPEGYVENLKTTDFIMPKIEGRWLSRSSAASRRNILERAGFTAIVQRSAPIVWPNEGQERVDSSSAAEVMAALRTLKRHGVIRSVDAIL